MGYKKESFLKGIFALLLSQVFIKIIGLMYKLYLTNKEGFGDCGNAIYSSGFQIYALLLTFSSTGVPNAISKLVSERVAIGDNRGAHRIFKISFVAFSLIGIAGSVLLFLGAAVIAEKWLQIPEAKYSLVCLSPSIFFVSISSVIRGYFNGRQSFTITAKSQTLEQIFKTIFTIALVEIVYSIGKKDTTIMAAAANLATTIATISSFCYIYFFYKSKRREIAQEISEAVNYIPTRVRKTIKQIIQVAFPISISSLISSFNKNIDSFTVVRFLKMYMEEDDAKIQYGILSGKIDVLCTLPLSFNIAFVTALVPNISKSMAKGDFKSVRLKSELFILICIVIAFPITLVMFLFSKQILELLFPNASVGAMYLKVSSLSIIFVLLAQTINAILQGIGKVEVPAIAFGVGMICKFICNIVLLPNSKVGIYGAIIGNIICNVVASLIGIVALNKSIKIKFEFFKFIFKPTIATIFMGISSRVIYRKLIGINLGNIAIILALFVSSIIYIVFIIMLRVFSKEEIKVFQENTDLKK